MKITRLFLFTGLFLAFNACSPVKFYSDAALTKESGIKYYTVKPYILVDRDQASRNVVKATVLYLPDLSNPQYLLMKDGLGSRKVDIKLDEGTISTLSVASDPKLDETIESVAALVAKSSDAIKDLSGLKGIPGATAQNITELYEVVMGTEGTNLKKVEF